MLTDLQVSSLAFKCIFANQNVMPRGDLTEFNFERLET